MNTEHRTTAPATAAGVAGRQRIVANESEALQATIDAAEPGSTIVVRGEHVENVWVNKDGFHGRHRLVNRVISRLGSAGPKRQFVAFVGPSGSGKSSVVRAGVVHTIRRGAVAGSDHGSDPRRARGSGGCSCPAR